MMNSIAGKVGSGRRRTKCRWNRTKGFFWKNTPTGCIGCDPEIPTVNDSNVTVACTINRINKRVCTATCSNGGTILGEHFGDDLCDFLLFPVRFYCFWPDFYVFAKSNEYLMNKIQLRWKPTQNEM